MEFAILGPVAASRDGKVISLARRQPRVLLAVLLSHANQAVSTDRLIAAVWSERPPRTAAKNLQVNIWHLRRLLGGDDRVSFGAAGYTLRVGPDELDAGQFERLAVEGRRTRASGDPVRAAQLLRAAEALWRGTPFAGDDDVLELQAEAGRLTQLRRTVLEERLAADLLARPLDDVIGELRAATALHPLWESLWAMLMTALSRAGHRAEALEEYRVARQRFVDELGLEPGPYLQEIQRQILRGEEEPATTATPAVMATTPVTAPVPAPRGAAIAPPVIAPPGGPPFLLPADIADFTGRAEHVDLLCEHLTAPDRDTPVVCTVAGPGGVGKTTLAVHVAHRVRDRFPDGVLYLNLRGAEVRPVSPGEALGQVLRAIGVAGTAIPDDLDERAALYRDRLADRRVLAVLDNVANEAQVAPLIPGTPSAGVLITSRARLTALPGARGVQLDVLNDAQSADLLGHIVGADRLANEPEATADLVRLCGGLPLALRIAGGRLASRPHWDIAKLAARLVDERHRLDELSHGQLEVRGSVALSYHSLDLAARCLLRRLAMLEATDIAPWTAAALLDVGLAEAEDVIERLVDTHLVDVDGRDPTGTTRYRMHDLVRVFARERAADEDRLEDWRAALARAGGAWLYLAEVGNIRVWGGDFAVLHGPARRWRVEDADRLLKAPLVWFLTERPCILAIIRQTAEADLVELCWDLTVTATVLYQTCSLYDDWRESHDYALAICRRAGDRRGEAIVLTKLGWLHAHQHRDQTARGLLTPARDIFVEIGEPHGVALAEHALAYVEHLHGRHRTALHRHLTAAAALEAAGDKGAAGAALRTAGQIHLERNEVGRARAELERALDVIGSGGGAVFRGLVLAQFSELYLRIGELPAAERDIQTVLDITRRHADIRGQAFCLHRLARVRRRQGRQGEALDMFAQALAFSRQVSDRVIESQVLLDIGRLQRDGGRLTEAAATLRESARLAEAVPVPLWQAWALRELGAVLRRGGDEVGARTALAAQADLSDRYELPALFDEATVDEPAVDKPTDEGSGDVGTARGTPSVTTSG